MWSPLAQTNLKALSLQYKIFQVFLLQTHYYHIFPLLIVYSLINTSKNMLRSDHLNYLPIIFYGQVLYLLTIFSLSRMVPYAAYPARRRHPTSGLPASPPFFPSPLSSPYSQGGEKRRGSRCGTSQCHRLTSSLPTLLPISLLEVGYVTLKSNGVTRYRLCYETREVLLEKR